MADLTLERIAELRKWAENFASAGLPYCDGITPKQLVSLLDAAERGLTGGWVRNGPDVEKPKGDCVCRIETGRFVVLGWSANGLKECWSANRDGYTLCVVDESVSHFMPIKEPTDGK